MIERLKLARGVTGYHIEQPMEAHVNIDVKAIQERVRREQACPRHRYEIGPGPYTMGAKYICAHCGAQKRLFEISDYVRGYAAAGGNPLDVCPEWPGASA